MVLPKTAGRRQRDRGGGPARGYGSAHALAAILAIADAPASPELGKLLYKASTDNDNYSDRWLSRAMFIAATRHKAAFLAEYKADPKAVPSGALPIALRIGATKPDWRTPDKASLSTDWKDMQVPGSWESRGLEDFDGVVWFTRTIDAPQGAGEMNALARPHQQHRRSVGERAVGDQNVDPAAGRAPPRRPPAVVEVAAARRRPALRRRGRGNLPYELPSGTLKPGPNTITVRITNNRNDGGFLGTPETMFAQAGETRIPLAGTWKYRVERQTNAGALYSKPGELAAHVALANTPARDGDAARAGGPRRADVVIRLDRQVRRNAVRQDRADRGAGQLVEIVFTNPDAMQHNFVLGQPDSLEGDRPGRRRSRAHAERAGAAIRAADSADHVLDQARRARRDADGGAEFIPIYQTHPNAEMYAICRRERKELDACGDRFGVKARYTDYDELLADPNVDAVHINSPIADHAPQSIAALKAGKHVACTVPMATTIDECRQIVEAQRKSGKVYMMMETVVYSREYLFAKELYDKGELGRIQFLRGSHQQDMDGWPGYWRRLPPMHYATHCVSPCLAILGKHAEHVVCHGSGAHRRGADPEVRQPVRDRDGDVQDRDSDVCAEVTRSLFDTARQYRESFDVYGSKKSFEWQQVENEEPVIHTRSTAEAPLTEAEIPRG